MVFFISLWKGGINAFRNYSKIIGVNYKEIIINQLAKQNLTLAIAESVTGGMVCSTLIDITNASQVLKGGVVAYTDFAKRKLLGVSEATLERYSAYSAIVAREMAVGIKNKLDGDIGIGISGIAEPNQDHSECLVYFCIVLIDKAHDFEMIIPNEGRINNRIVITSKVIEELFKLVYQPHI